MTSGEDPSGGYWPCGTPRHSGSRGTDSSRELAGRSPEPKRQTDTRTAEPSEPAVKVGGSSHSTQDARPEQLGPANRTTATQGSVSEMASVPTGMCSSGADRECHSAVPTSEKDAYSLPTAGRDVRTSGAAETIHDPSNSASGTDWGRATRRGLLIGTALVSSGLASRALWQRVQRQRAAVFVARHQRYDGSLVPTIRDGLLATGLEPKSLQGKRVLLKPNLVEPSRAAPHVTTHPTVILATAEVFRGWGAEVVVGEGPGHVRDTEMALIESGVDEALQTGHLPFADLNYEPVVWIANQGRASKLPGFYLPRSVVAADLIVSLPKLKTHHWMGMTAAMKNLYGTLPGLHYGWPKNVLHHAGIPQTVFDINASLPKTITVIDGIDCMEGDGPILGSMKSLGWLLVSTNPTAADATAARLMRLRPERIDYLSLAQASLGPIDEPWIDQVGEPWQPLAQPFQMLPLPHLQQLCA